MAEAVELRRSSTGVGGRLPGLFDQLLLFDQPAEVLFVDQPAGKRFDDLKERFTFTSTSDLVELEDWRGRGITPIQYDAEDNHRALRATLERWAALSPINGKKALVDTALRRIVRKDRRSAKDVDRDLFDHFFRRDTASERARMSSLVSEVGAGLEWLDAILKISAEPERRRQF